MEDQIAVVLAAGKGTRMGGELPKVLHETVDGPLLSSVLRELDQLSLKKIVLIVGYEKSRVIEACNALDLSTPLETVVQEQQKGTGDAVRSALSAVEDHRGEILICCGDTPLLRSGIFRALFKRHEEAEATLSLLSTLHPIPGAYGRILRNKENGEIEAIREAKDCKDHELLNHEVNAGVYVVDSAFLPGALQTLESENAQGEYYLTDIVQKAVVEGQRVASVVHPDPEEIQGVNTPQQLALVNRSFLARRCEELVKGGVKLLDPHSLFIDRSAVVESGTVIGPNVQLLGATSIASGVTIEGTALIRDSSIGADSVLKLGVRIEEARVGSGASVGPFAHLRPGTEAENGVKIGNFVEIKKSKLGEGAKVNHLSYIGDASVGREANIGAGTITCNYDGYKKSLTEIGEGSFIGSNSALVAPVKIGNRATVGAGSTITKAVSDGALALTRPEQREIPGWSESKRKREQKG